MRRQHNMRRSPSSSRDNIRQILAFSTTLQNYRHSIAAALEPLIRTVVREEVQRIHVHQSRNLQRQSQMQISPEVPLYQLTFKSPPKTPIFAGAKIRDCEGNSIQILLVRPTEFPCSCPSPIRIELVVLDGDFPSHDHWTSDDFEKAIVKERTGRRPLLTGDVNVTMRGGVAMIGNLQFTDNSSWIRSRHFRIGVRVVPGSYEQTVIKETMTEKFTVKDHRGESYRKHYPPVLTDEVWRLEKIRKDGPFHNKLSENNIRNIQDFLKLLIVDSVRLRHIVLNGMTEKMWQRVKKHASTCDLGDKIYFYCGKEGVIYINSICEVLLIKVGDVPYTFKDLPKNYMDYVQHLVREAYLQWDILREADESDVNVALIRGRISGQGGAGPMQWYPNSSQDSGIIEFKGDADEGISSVSFQFDQVSSMEWTHDFDQIL